MQMNRRADVEVNFLHYCGSTKITGLNRGKHTPFDSHFRPNCSWVDVQDGDIYLMFKNVYVLHFNRAGNY